LPLLEVAGDVLEELLRVPVERHQRDR
jgi:hypothetical protein